VLSRSRPLAMVLVVVAGAIFGPVFPTVLAVLLAHTHPSVHGRAVGLFFAIGGIGWTLIPILIGARARQRGVRGGFWVAVAAAVTSRSRSLAISSAGARIAARRSPKSTCSAMRKRWAITLWSVCQHCLVTKSNSGPGCCRPPKNRLKNWLKNGLSAGSG